MNKMVLLAGIFLVMVGMTGLVIVFVDGPKTYIALKPYLK